MLIINCLFPKWRVGNRQVLHLFIKTVTILCRKLKTKYIATNNIETFYTITIGWVGLGWDASTPISYLP